MAPKPGKRRAETYRHDEDALLRPEVGLQAQFAKKKPPRTYRYDSSLSPALDWDGDNWAREYGEWLPAQIQEASALPAPHRFEATRVFDGADRAVEGLAAPPLTSWPASGGVSRLGREGRAALVRRADTAALRPRELFVHERLSTKAILETLAGHARDRQLEMQLFADPQLPLHQQLEAYEHRGGWVNRMILGYSLAVMNSLLE